MSRRQALLLASTVVLLTFASTVFVARQCADGNCNTPPGSLAWVVFCLAIFALVCAILTLFKR